MVYLFISFTCFLCVSCGWLELYLLTALCKIWQLLSLKLLARFLPALWDFTVSYKDWYFDSKWALLIFLDCFLCIPSSTPVLLHKFQVPRPLQTFYLSPNSTNSHFLLGFPFSVQLFRTSLQQEAEIIVELTLCLLRERKFLECINFYL